MLGRLGQSDRGLYLYFQTTTKRPKFHNDLLGFSPIHFTDFPHILCFGLRISFLHTGGIRGFACDGAMNSGGRVRSLPRDSLHTFVKVLEPGDIDTQLLLIRL